VEWQTAISNSGQQPTATFTQYSMELNGVQQGEGSEQIFDCAKGKVSLIVVLWDKTVGITEILGRLKKLKRCQRPTFFVL
jgi:hypothetical protein